MRKAIFSNRCAVRLIGLVLALSLNLTGIPQGDVEISSAQAAENTAPSQAVFKSEHVYQARGGDIHFTVSGDLKSQPDMKAELCWKLSAEKGCVNDTALPVRRLKETLDPPGVDYVVTIPRAFVTAPDDFAHNLFWFVPSLN